ncbi:MAG TPA: hypothetical protein DD001_20270 [Microcoleaceae bacterium UBA10368]|jgi:hypothetical protein|nr:hypothetical protein [Microcoleaceae cyanobacterium UBA10368]HCV31369.1 hypothetical protein [Microcoleaceae cyanobacterium UBA9251]
MTTIHRFKGSLAKAKVIRFSIFDFRFSIDPTDKCGGLRIFEVVKISSTKAQERLKLFPMPNAQ